MELSEVAFSGSGKPITVSTGQSIAILDSGTSFTMVPQNVLENILNALNDGNIQQVSGMFYLPCSDAHGRKFTFTFGNVQIDVDLSQFLIPADTQNIHCALGFDATQENQYTLGDTFLRSVYAVYDLENNQVGLAPASFNPSHSNVVPFPSKGAKIPASTSGSGGGSSSGSGGSNSHSSGAASSLPMLWFDGLFGLSLPAASVIAMAVTIFVAVV